MGTDAKAGAGVRAVLPKLVDSYEEGEPEGSMERFRNRNGNDRQEKKIVVTTDGPYVVHGSIPLVRKIQVVSEYGEPLTWKTGPAIETPEIYELCRCGESGFPPFCDVTHALIDFDGTETADTRPTAERQVRYPGGTRIVVRRDLSLCMESGFCGNRFTDVEKMVAHTDDPQVRAQVMAMIERCPSGSYVYSLEEGEEDVEPDLPQQIAVITEITSEGPIAGPLWVTGHIPIERADGQPFETRNRVTLCRCGHSRQKPLCDGTHRELAAEKSAGS
jgi:CDGSH-type Zn-finger protein